MQVHILPQQIFGKSTFGLSMWLLKWFSVQFVDKFLLLMSDLILGDTSQFGIERPKIGPLELKNLYGKTPVLDVGTVAQIKTGKIKVTFSLHTNQIQKDFFILLCFLVLTIKSKRGFHLIMFSCLNKRKKNSIKLMCVLIFIKVNFR